MNRIAFVLVALVAFFQMIKGQTNAQDAACQSAITAVGAVSGCSTALEDGDKSTACSGVCGAALTTAATACASSVCGYSNIYSMHAIIAYVCYVATNIRRCIAAINLHN